MARRRKVTDYNAVESNKFVRTAQWWLAPDQVTKKSKTISGIFLGVLAIALVGMFFFRPDSEPEPQAAPTPATEASISSVVTTPPKCPEQEAKEFLPELLINGSYTTSWSRDGDMTRPTSEEAGPRVQTPYPSCFARTPEGALYAAASFATGALTAISSGDEKAFFEDRVSRTGNYTVLMADLPDTPTINNRPTSKISGYRWNNYSPDMASVEIQFTLVTGDQAGRNTAITYGLVWESNDWLVIVPGRNDSVVTKNVADRTYIPWGGPA